MRSRHVRGASAPSRAGTRTGDEGFALVAAIGVAFVCLLMATTVVAVAVRSGTSTGADRARVLASAAAEAGIDAAVVHVRQDLALTTQRTFSCSAPVSDVWASPGRSQVSVTFVFTTGSATTTCPLVNGTPYTKVTVTSTATYTFGAVTTVRRMSAVIPLNPSTTPAAGAFSRAVFSNGNLSPASPFQVMGDVYTNGNFSCSSYVTVTGTLTVQGQYSPCSTFSASSVQTSTSATVPQAMPGVTYNSLAAMGATVLHVSDVPGGSGCTIGYSSTTWRTPAFPVVVDARSCATLTLNGSPRILLSGDVTFVAQSLVVNTPLTANSGDAQPHALRLVVPAQSESAVCTAGGGALTVSSYLNIGNPVSVFLYTPGLLSISSPLADSTSAALGSIYSCRSSYTSYVNLQYAPSAVPTTIAYAPSSPTKTDLGAG